jgi:hypothetical protein
MKRHLKKNKIHPKKVQSNYIQECSTNEQIFCYGCQRFFSLESNEIKLHCAGCNKFFHCKIAGTCYGYHGKPCKEKIDYNSEHNLSWCISCVPGIDENKIRKNRTDSCVCQECFQNYSTKRSSRPRLKNTTDLRFLS